MTPQTDHELVKAFEALRRLNPDAPALLEITRAIDRMLIAQARARLKTDCAAAPPR